MILNNRQIFKNSFYLYLASGVNILFPIFLIPILVSRITLESYGILILLQTIMNYGNTFVDFGYNLIGVKKISSANSDKISLVLGEALILKPFLVILSLIIIPITILVFPIFNHDWLLVSFGWLNVVGYAFYPLWYFQGIERMEFISIFNLISKSLVFCSIYILVNNQDDLRLAILLLSSSFLINSIISWCYIFLKETIIFPSLSCIKKYYKDGLQIFISNIVVQFYSNGVLLLSSNILLAENLAILGVFLKIRDVLVSVISPVQQAIFPGITKLAYLDNKQEIKQIVSKILKLLIGVVILYFIFLIIFKNQINYYLFTGVEGMRTTSFIYLFFLFILLPFGGVYTKILVGYNKLQWVKNTTLWSCIFTLIMSYPFMKYFDIYGALLVMTFSYFLNGFLGYYYTKKLLS